MSSFWKNQSLYRISSGADSLANMFLSRKTEMIDPRAERPCELCLHDSSEHYVNGHPLVGPFRRVYRRRFWGLAVSRGAEKAIGN